MKKAKTSAAVKNRYNKKAYDRITIVVPKGERALIRSYAESKGKTVSSYLKELIPKSKE